MRQILTATIILAALFLQSCSKKTETDGMNNKPPTDPVETATLKYIPDSVLRAYLKANICPNAFDRSGKFIDITNPEVKDFSGTIQVDSFTCPRPFVASLRGVQYFTKMKKLIVKNSLADSLDLSATVALDTLRLLINKDMQYVLLGGCTSLRYVRISDIPATSLNFSNLPELNYINLISLQRLSELKTDNAAKLRHLMVYGLSSMKKIDVSTNANLGRLYAESCTALNAIDVTHNRKLYGLVATNCYTLKGIDLSKNDSLRFVQFDDSSIDSVDFSHNPELFSIAMFRTPLRNLNLLANPKVCVLSLDGCVSLKTVDLRAQKNFDYYLVPSSAYNGMSEDDRNQIFQDGLASPVQTAQHTFFGQATRAGVNGATQNIFAGLRVPQFLDASGLSLAEVKVNKAVKDNYSLVMARRVLGSMTPAVITVYDDDRTTVLCPDYSPELFKCN